MEQLQSPLSWDRYFLSIATTVAQKSKDPRTRIGAVIVGPEHREIRATGFNGFPSGVSETAERWERPEKHMRVVHAETNALISAARVGVPLYGCTLYTLCLPCLECTKLICQAGIRRVVVERDFMASYVNSSWLTPEIGSRIREMLSECSVLLEQA